MEQSALTDRSVSKKLQEVFNGENLAQHLLDKNYLVRYAVCETGFGLDTLINDPEPMIRRQVAKQGYGLEHLLYDSNEWVRAAVAENAFGLDILIHDENRHVRNIAERIVMEKSEKSELKAQIKEAEKLSHIFDNVSHCAMHKRGNVKNAEKEIHL